MESKQRPVGLGEVPNGVLDLAVAGLIPWPEAVGCKVEDATQLLVGIL